MTQPCEVANASDSPDVPLPPHSAELEAAVLSAWSLNEKFGRAWKPEPELFFTTTHHAVASAMAKLDRDRRDHASIVDQLRTDGKLDAAGGPGVVYRAIVGAPAYGDPWPHVAKLREYRALRDVLNMVTIATSDALKHRDLNAMVVRLQEAIRIATAGRGTKISSVRDMFRGIAQGMIDKVERRFVSTGVPSLDRDTGGFQYKQVAILGAATSWGKSAFAIMQADNAMRAGLRPLLVTVEDSEELYSRRLMARRAKVRAADLRSGRISEGDFSRVLSAAERAETFPFFVEALGMSAERIASDIVCFCASEGIDLVIVDYVQAIQCAKRQQDRRNEVGYVARVLTDAIKTGQAAGLMFSQFKRPMKPGEKPTKFDLKEAGELENGAEMVLLGYLNGDGDPVLKVDKCKDGISGNEYPLAWNDVWCGFEGEASGWTSNGTAEPPEAFNDRRYP